MEHSYLADHTKAEAVLKRAQTRCRCRRLSLDQIHDFAQEASELLDAIKVPINARSGLGIIGAAGGGNVAGSYIGTPMATYVKLVWTRHGWRLKKAWRAPAKYNTGWEFDGFPDVFEEKVLFWLGKRRS